jgi:transposase
MVITKRKISVELKKMKFLEIYGMRSQGKLTIEEAAELLGVNERTFRRYCTSYSECGIDGLLDKRIGKAAHNAAPVDEVIDLTRIYKTHYEPQLEDSFTIKYKKTSKT